LKVREKLKVYAASLATAGGSLPRVPSLQQSTVSWFISLLEIIGTGVPLFLIAWGIFKYVTEHRGEKNIGEIVENIIWYIVAAVVLAIAIWKFVIPFVQTLAQAPGAGGSSGSSI